MLARAVVVAWSPRQELFLSKCHQAALLQGGRIVIKTHTVVLDEIFKPVDQLVVLLQHLWTALFTKLQNLTLTRRKIANAEFPRKSKYGLPSKVLSDHQRLRKQFDRETTCYCPGSYWPVLHALHLLLKVGKALASGDSETLRLNRKHKS